MKFTVRTDINETIAEQLSESAGRASKILAQQVKKDTEPYVPFLTGSLNTRTQVRGSQIIYPGPYARYLYAGKVMVDENGNGPMHFIDKNGNEVIRFRKGSKLHATDKNLVFTTAHHPQAQAHWFEASKAQNIEKWERVVAKALGEG